MVCPFGFIAVVVVVIIKITRCHCRVVMYARACVRVCVCAHSVDTGCGELIWYHRNQFFILPCRMHSVVVVASPYEVSKMCRAKNRRKLRMQRTWWKNQKTIIKIFHVFITHLFFFFFRSFSEEHHHSQGLWLHTYSHQWRRAYPGTEVWFSYYWKMKNKKKEDINDITTINICIMCTASIVTHCAMCACACIVSFNMFSVSCSYFVFHFFFLLVKIIRS